MVVASSKTILIKLMCRAVEGEMLWTRLLLSSAPGHPQHELFNRCCSVCVLKEEVDNKQDNRTGGCYNQGLGHDDTLLSCMRFNF